MPRAGGSRDDQSNRVRPHEAASRFCAIRVGADPDGAWRWTTWELLQLAEYLGHQDFSAGFGSQGTSVLHEAEIVLGSWSTAAMFRIIELRQPFSAFVGEGDGAE